MGVGFKGLLVDTGEGDTGHEFEMFRYEGGRELWGEDGAEAD